jgi:2-oxoglutarate ferredoxin oxidoreductase subunit delta
MERFDQGDFYLATERAFCKGCGLCVSSCPVEILRVDNKNKILVTDIAKCVFCGLCEARCPDFAIWIVKESLTNAWQGECLR